MKLTEVEDTINRVVQEYNQTHKRKISSVIWRPEHSTTLIQVGARSQITSHKTEKP